jgi:hypothetical protein
MLMAARLALVEVPIAATTSTTFLEVDHGLRNTATRVRESLPARRGPFAPQDQAIDGGNPRNVVAPNAGQPSGQWRKPRRNHDDFGSRHL